MEYQIMTNLNINIFLSIVAITFFTLGFQLTNIINYFTNLF